MKPHLATIVGVIAVIAAPVHRFAPVRRWLRLVAILLALVVVVGGV